MIFLYHLHNSRSQRIVWLLEELNCRYKLLESPEIIEPTLPAEVLPLKFPTLKYFDAEGTLYLTETSAICDFLSQKHKALLPEIKSSSALANFTFWKNYADASLMQTLVLKQVFKQIVLNTPFLFKPISLMFKHSFNSMFLNKELAQQLKRIEAHLKTNAWMCGSEFTVADILIWFPLEAAMVGVEVQDYPRISAYLDRIKLREPFIKAAKQGNWSADEFNKYWT